MVASSRICGCELTEQVGTRERRWLKVGMRRAKIANDMDQAYSREVYIRRRGVETLTSMQAHGGSELPARKSQGLPETMAVRANCSLQ